MSCSFPSGCGCSALDIDPKDPNGGDFDEVLFAERTSAEGAIIRQYELACRIFAVQKSIGDRWRNTDGKWASDLYNGFAQPGGRRSISNDINQDTILSRYGLSMDKVERGASIGMFKRMSDFRVDGNVRTGHVNNDVTDVSMTAPLAKGHGVHHLLKYSLNRYYTNDDATYEALIAAYHGGAVQPEPIFALLGNAQSQYSSIAAAATTQQRKAKKGGIMGAIIGGITGYITGGPVGAAVGAYRGYQ